LKPNNTQRQIEHYLKTDKSKQAFKGLKYITHSYITPTKQAPRNAIPGHRTNENDGENHGIVAIKLKRDTKKKEHSSNKSRRRRERKGIAIIKPVVDEQRTAEKMVEQATKHLSTSVRPPGQQNHQLCTGWNKVFGGQSTITNLHAPPPLFLGPFMWWRGLGTASSS
ncbi:MAG: hypothetical protein AAGM46_28575, partial [Cyanobacteria bacterium J06582_2]